MMDHKNTELPAILRNPSSEIFLSNSQTPSFANTRNTPDTFLPDFSNLPSKIELKRQKLFSPGKCVEPKEKRMKTEKIQNFREKQRGFLRDFCWEIEEAEKRLNTILRANIDIFEMFKFLRQSSAKIQLPQSLLIFEDSPENSGKCSVEDRKSIILHIFSRRFGLKISAETLHLGAALLDNCLDKMSVNREKIEELGAVSLVIASKIEDVDCLSIGSIVEMNLVETKSVSMLFSLERFILITLDFQVTIPTPLSFATYLLVHLDASPDRINLTNYLLELSLLYVHNRQFSSDLVGYAATCLAFVVQPDSESEDLTSSKLNQNSQKVLRNTEERLKEFGDFSKSEQREVMRTILDLYIVAPEENHTVYREYSTTRRNFVAKRKIPEDLQEVLLDDDDE